MVIQDEKNKQRPAIENKKGHENKNNSYVYIQPIKKKRGLKNAVGQDRAHR